MGRRGIYEAGQVELAEAATAAQEAAEVSGRLARHLPAVFTDDLRGVLRTMADVLDELNRQAEAHEIRRSLDDSAMLWAVHSNCDRHGMVHLASDRADWHGVLRTRSETNAEARFPTASRHLRPGLCRPSSTAAGFSDSL